jgi:hypothetical protein
MVATFYCCRCLHTDKKENQIFHIRKFRMEQLQIHKLLTESSYMGKYLHISSYVYKEALPHI